MTTINPELAKLVSENGSDRVVRSLQVYLGYHPSTYIPTIDEFIEKDEYLGKVTNNGKGIYKYWREKLREIFPNPLLVNYDTVFLRSAIGTGKSSVARIIILYTMAKMILMENPHEFFGLLPNKDLVVFFYSLQISTINSAMYNPIVEMIDSSKFFKSHMDTSRKGYHFKNKIKIVTGSTIAKNVGLDIFAIFMDEIQIERIKGSNYRNYNSLKARIKSRFMMDSGVFFNSISVISGSPGSAEAFSEKLTVKNEDNEKSLILNTPQWEVLKDKIKYSGVTFKVFIGDDSNEPRIITDERELETYEEMVNDPEVFSKVVLNVPIEYKQEFEDDILIAIRDIAGAVTRSTHSFITNVEKLKQAFVIKSKFFNIDVIKLPFFGTTKVSDYLIKSDEKLNKRLMNPDNYRFIHIDIGIVSDLTGIAMTHIAGQIENEYKSVYDQPNTKSMDPWYINDFNIGISRNRNEETNISKIRDFIVFLRDSNVNIHTVTVDGYQSTQLRQELTAAGINCELMSMTRDSKGFDVFKRAIYSERFQICRNAIAQKEFLQFKKVIRMNNKVKVVHPDSSSSGTGTHGDIAESIAGSVYSAYLRYKSGVDVLSGFNHTLDSLLHKKYLSKDVSEESAENEFFIMSSLF